MRLGTLGLVATVMVSRAALVSLAAPVAADAQSTGKIWRLGYLSLVSGELEQYKPWLAAFRDGLRELGYVEGQNVVIEQRFAAGHVERLPALAAELVRLKVDNSRRGAGRQRAGGPTPASRSRGSSRAGKPC